MKTTLTIRSPKPRNPFVTASRQRKAGAHRVGDQRRSAKRQLASELALALSQPGLHSREPTAACRPKEDRSC
jgi:hypothetical protein